MYWLVERSEEWPGVNSTRTQVEGEPLKRWWFDRAKSARPDGGERTTVVESRHPPHVEAGASPLLTQHMTTAHPFECACGFRPRYDQTMNRDLRNFV